MGDSSETQEKILNAAIKLFAKNGYHGTATIEIAREAGISEASIFKYYKTKKDLLKSVLRKIVGEIIPGLALTTLSAVNDVLREGDIKENVKTLILGLLGKISGNIDVFKVLINEIQYHDDIKKEYLGGFIPYVLGTLENFFRLGMDKGYFKELSPHVAARSIMGMVAIMVLEANVLGKPIDFEKELDAILEIYTNGVLIKKEGV